jgi:hypothetical protein
MMEREGSLVSDRKSIISMERKLFNHNREMKMLFADSAAQFGSSVAEELKEERKFNP